MSSIFQEATGILYFDELESPAFTTVQAAFDRVGKGFGSKVIWTTFCKEMNELGYPRPTEKEMNRFISAVEAGKISRPERTLTSADEPHDAVDHTHSVSDKPPAEDVQPPAVIDAAPVQPVADPIIEAFNHLHDLLFAEAKAELERDIDDQARKVASSRIRSLASTVTPNGA